MTVPKEAAPSLCGRSAEPFRMQTAHPQLPIGDEKEPFLSVTDVPSTTQTCGISLFSSSEFYHVATIIIPTLQMSKGQAKSFVQGCAHRVGGGSILRLRFA